MPYLEQISLNHLDAHTARLVSTKSGVAMHLSNENPRVYNRKRDNLTSRKEAC